MDRLLDGRCGRQASALTVSAMVFVVIYLFAQKTFVRSITAGAVKG